MCIFIAGNGSTIISQMVAITLLLFASFNGTEEWFALFLPSLATFCFLPLFLWPRPSTARKRNVG